MRQYYNFDDVDVDRYKIDGHERVLMVSPREIDQAGLAPAAQTWPNQHLTYTHGYGAVAAQVNAARPRASRCSGSRTSRRSPATGADDEAARDLLRREQRRAVRRRRTRTSRSDNSAGGSTAPYAGKGGIQLSNFFRRAMFAWRYRDYNLLVSSSITSKSRIMINRDIQTRIRKPVPFLGFDSDPYFAIVDGQPRVDLGRVHVHRPVPVLAGGRRRRRDRRALGASQLPAELREGRRWTRTTARSPTTPT